MGRGHAENSPSLALLLPAPGAFLECSQHTGGCTGLCLVKPIVPHLVFPRMPWKSFPWARFPGQAQLWGYQNPTGSKEFISGINDFTNNIPRGGARGCPHLVLPCGKAGGCIHGKGPLDSPWSLLLTPARPSSGWPGLGLWRPLDVRVTPCSRDTRQVWHIWLDPEVPACPRRQAGAKHSLCRTRNQRKSQEKAG